MTCIAESAEKSRPERSEGSGRCTTQKIPRCAAAVRPLRERNDKPGQRIKSIVVSATVCLIALLWGLGVADAARAAEFPNGTELHLPLVAASSDASGAEIAGLEPALRAALGRIAPNEATELTSLRASGDSAVAAARADGQERAEILLLARYADASGWQVTTSLDAPDVFNAALDQMPADLLDEGDRAFLRRIESRAGRRVALFADHSLPWPGGQIGYVMQRDGSGHESQVDFDILGLAAPGPVYASKPGVVVFVKDSSASGCPSMLCWQQANMVVVQHGPGEYSWYVHLAPGSARVRVGDRVGYGSMIGVEGATGFASGVHLHYMASTGHTAWTPPDDPNRAPWALGIQAVNFREAAWSSLIVGQRYTSQNGSDGSCTGSPLAADQVALYEHADYCGLYTVLGPGDYPTAAAFLFYNDRVSSIRVGDDAAVVLCQDEQYGGACETFDADVPNLTGSAVGNDQVSSVKVGSRQELTAPETPQLQQPAEDALITTTVVSLMWEPAIRAAAYQVQIALTSDFDSPTTDVITASTGVTVSGLAEKAHVWRVRAVNSGGLWGEWSEPRTFTLDVAPYRHPYPQSPDDGAALAASRVQLSWIDTETITSHRLQLYTGEQSSPDSGESSLVADAVITDTAYTTELLADGLYSWRVCRINARGAAVRCSDFRTLTVDTEPPPSPALASYADGAETGDHTPTLAWKAVEGAASYNIQVFLDRGGKSAHTGPLEPRTLGPLISAVTQETSYTTRRLADGRYGWRVRARDAAGNWSEWSEPRALTVVTPAWVTYLPALSAR